MIADTEFIQKYQLTRAAIQERLEQTRLDLVELDRAVQGLSGNLAVAQKGLSKAKVPQRLSLTRTAHYLGVGRTTLTRLIAEQGLTKHIDPDGRPYLRKNEVDSWLDSHDESVLARRKAS